MQSELGFQARKFQPDGFEKKEDFVKHHGVDLYMADVQEYDKICKVLLGLGSGVQGDDRVSKECSS